MTTDGSKLPRNANSYLTLIAQLVAIRGFGSHAKAFNFLSVKIREIRGKDQLLKGRCTVSRFGATNHIFIISQT